METLDGGVSVWLGNAEDHSSRGEILQSSKSH
jgi:hypothetical protein